MSRILENDVALPEAPRPVMSDNSVDDQNSSINAPIGAGGMLEGSQLHTVPETSVSGEGNNRKAKSRASLSILKQATDRRQEQQRQPIGYTSHPDSPSPMGSGPHNFVSWNANNPPQILSPTLQLHPMTTRNQQQPSGSPIKILGSGSGNKAGERQAPAASLGGARKKRASRRRPAPNVILKPGPSLNPEDQAVEEIRLRMGRMDVGNNKKAQAVSDNKKAQAVSDNKGRPNPGIAPALATGSKLNITAGQTADTSHRLEKRIANSPYLFPGWDAPFIGEFKGQGHIHSHDSEDSEWDRKMLDELLSPNILGPWDY